MKRFKDFHFTVGSEERLTVQPEVKRFAEIALPHLHATYRLARWLIRSDQEAEDVVQDVYLSAFKSFAGFNGTDGKAWIMAIARNACYRWLRDNVGRDLVDSFDEEVHSPDSADSLKTDCDSNPESYLLRQDRRRMICYALERLPAEFGEIIVLRELEGYSYKEIADIVNVPIGTVMSRLARGRNLMLKCLEQMNWNRHEL